MPHRGTQHIKQTLTISTSSISSAGIKRTIQKGQTITQV